jgi:hypothetical protein
MANWPQEYYHKLSLRIYSALATHSLGLGFHLVLNPFGSIIHSFIHLLAFIDPFLQVQKA